MKSLVDFTQPLVGDVGVHLRSGDVFVAEQFLDATKVGVVREKISRV